MLTYSINRCTYIIPSSNVYCSFLPRLVLKKHSAADKSTAWTPIVSTPKGGGSNLVVLNLVVGDQLGVWTEGTGALLTAQDSDVHVTSFSGFRISKNNKVELKS